MTKDQKQIMIVGLAILIFLAGFAAADILLFKGAITPEPLKPLVGWIVCLGVGGYVCSLFLHKNKT